ncbi:MAG: tyrosine-protein phosphatase [Sphingomonadales bacterium]|nr:MAG: tyrosine-protein phosphatase [Sphingomonadales bacterium]
MRQIQLQRATNFRDAGGYATRFRRAVRWGRIYRSGELTKITDADILDLEALGLKLIYDLRTSGERSNRPSRAWGTVRRLHRDYSYSGADLPSIVARTDVSSERLRGSMLALYGGLPFDQAEAFRSMFMALAEGEFPLLFHCAGGKDRTGAFAALLHDLLGVSREDILADYLLSNDSIEAARARFLSHIGRDDVDPSIWDPMLLVTPDYLDAMFAAIDARHGNTDAYWSWLGLSPETVAAIRENLLEPA